MIVFSAPRVEKGYLTVKPHFVLQKSHDPESRLGTRRNAAVKRAGIRHRNPYHTQILCLPAIIYNTHFCS
ncbi:hypothetical protein GAG18_12665 [Salmonella enterica]|nr:hypothetical protein [Salmonella enterica]EBA5086442.1 hypothetical protein [Salmonella enterica]EDC3687543.1 hypothetical protein [Salmonella enterica]